MRIAYFGSSVFSVEPLKSIVPTVVCVVTKKAKPKGRGYLLEDNEVKRVALELNLPLVEITSFKDESSQSLKDYGADLFLVASFGLIIPRWVLDLPAIGPVNVHPSLLPRFRGPSPIQGAILHGDRETGITLIRMNEKMDQGNILYQEKAVIEETDTAESLSDRLSRRTGEILPEFIKKVERTGLDEGVVQNESEATYTSMITREMGQIDWTKGAGEIGDQIRAFVPWPIAYTHLDGLSLKIFGARIGRRGMDSVPGTITETGKLGITVATGDGTILLEDVQLENRRRMAAYDFARGYRGLIGKILGSAG